MDDLVLRPFPAAHKRCCRCGRIRPHADFNRCRRTRDGLYWCCRACQLDGLFRRRKYGLSSAAYAAMLASQGGVCAICRHPEKTLIGKTGTVKSLAVDHDHATGVVRGLLCAACNQAIGLLGHDAERLRCALDYLTSG